MEEALAWDTHRAADRFTGGGGMGGKDGGGEGIASELKGAWDRVSLLQKRYSDMQVGLGTEKSNETHKSSQHEKKQKNKYYVRAFDK
eukprot:1195081-Prorocentrum_minimum.AAC.3